MPSYKCDFCNGAITPVGSNSITLISYLPCFHAICQRCKANRFRGQERINCAVCNCQPQVNEIFDLVLHDPAKVACPSCPGTQKNRVELVCHNCNGQPICVTCSAQHRHAGHNIAQIRQELPSRSQCMNHPNVQATYWCTCNARLCNNCVVQHAQTAPDVPGGHTRKSYTNCADVARQKLNTLKTAQQRDSVGLQKLVPILTHNRAMIRDMSTRARTAVAGEIVELCNALIRRGNDIVTAIDMVEDAKLKQYARAEQDVKVAQDRLKKIEYFIDMACTTMQHDPPGVVSASIFAEGAYSHYNAKWQQMQQGLDVIQRKPSVCYFSDLPPILNSLQTLGQLEVDGVIKTPAPCTPQHARMFNVTNTAASTSRSVPRSNGAAPASGPAKGAGNRPPPLHPPNMPPNGYPGGPVLSPQFMHHAANVQQAASAQQYHMMAMQREAMMNHPGAMPPGYPGVPCSMHAHHPGQPALTIMTPNGPQLCCPPRFHPAQQAAMAAAAQNRGMPHAMIPNGPMVPNGVPRASGGQPILGRGPGSDGPGTPGSRSGNLHGATATAHIIESDRTAPLDARGQMISPHHTHLSNHSPAPLTCSPGSTPMPVRMARVRISAQSPQPSEEPTGTTQGDRQVDREPAGEQNASASSAVMPDSTTVTTTRAEENASGDVQKERLQKRPSNDDSENGGIKEGEPAAKRPHTSGQDDEMEPQQRCESANTCEATEMQPCSSTEFGPVSNASPSISTTMTENPLATNAPEPNNPEMPPEMGPPSQMLRSAVESQEQQTSRTPEPNNPRVDAIWDDVYLEVKPDIKKMLSPQAMLERRSQTSVPLTKQNRPQSEPQAPPQQIAQPTQPREMRAPEPLRAQSHVEIREPLATSCMPGLIQEKSRSVPPGPLELSNERLQSAMPGAMEGETDQMEGQSRETAQNGESGRENVGVSDLASRSTVIQAGPSSGQSNGGGVETGVEKPDGNQQAQAEVDNWDDYCYVCNQGCDEYTGELGCCSQCPHVYHNICHVPGIRKQMVELPDDWRCSICEPCEPLASVSGKFGPKERLLCSKVLLACFRDNQYAELFWNEVDRSVTAYYNIIKEPITLKEVAHKITCNKYERVEQFMEDMNRVFKNCSTFNNPSDAVAKAGRFVYTQYMNAVKKHLPCYLNSVWVYVCLYVVRNDDENGSNSRARHMKRSRRELSITK